MYSVVGIKEVNYTNKQGKPVEGKTFYLVDLDTRPGVTGNAVLEQFVSARCDAWNIAQNIKVNDKVNFYYNRFGQVGTISLEGGK